MRLYDTLSGQLHDFDSPNGQVRMYVCGDHPLFLVSHRSCYVCRVL